MYDRFEFVMVKTQRLTARQFSFEPNAPSLTGTAKKKSSPRIADYRGDHKHSEFARHTAQKTRLEIERDRYPESGSDGTAGPRTISSHAG